MSHYRLRMFAILPYCSKAQVASDRDRRFNELVWAVKNARPIEWGQGTGEDGAEYLVANAAERGWFPQWLHNRVLVPMPNSTPEGAPPDPDAGRPDLLADVLGRHLPGVEVIRAFRRIGAVPKASKATAGDRTGVAAHMASIELDAEALPEGRPVALVDDLVVKGTQSMACARLLAEAGVDDMVLVTAGYSVLGKEPRAYHFEGEILWDGRAKHARRPPIERRV